MNFLSHIYNNIICENQELKRAGLLRHVNALIQIVSLGEDELRHVLVELDEWNPTMDDYTNTISLGERIQFAKLLLLKEFQLIDMFQENELEEIVFEGNEHYFTFLLSLSDL